jgi:lipopolysaccharide export LptBFGC system permease protein LptF
MSVAELRKYIDEYEKSGFKTLDLETELNYKLSYPFANFILILLGIPIGLVLKKGGRGTSLALGLIISFGYYEAMAFFTTLGKGGFISPFLASWIPSLIFLTGGIYLFTRIERA